MSVMELIVLGKTAELETLINGSCEALGIPASSENKQSVLPLLNQTPQLASWIDKPDDFFAKLKTGIDAVRDWLKIENTEKNRVRIIEAYPELLQKPAAATLETLSGVIEALGEHNLFCAFSRSKVHNRRILLFANELPPLSHILRVTADGQIQQSISICDSFAVTLGFSPDLMRREMMIRLFHHVPGALKGETSAQGVVEKLGVALEMLGKENTLQNRQQQFLEWTQFSKSQQCSHPQCSLVRRKALPRCCGDTHYCSKECQRDDWARHKGVCTSKRRPSTRETKQKTASKSAKQK